MPKKFQRFPIIFNFEDQTKICTLKYKNICSLMPAKQIWASLVLNNAACVVCRLVAKQTLV